jgi:hypothetical protein
MKDMSSIYILSVHSPSINSSVHEQRRYSLTKLNTLEESHEKQMTFEVKTKQEETISRTNKSSPHRIQIHQPKKSSSQKKQMFKKLNFCFCFSFD